MRSSFSKTKGASRARVLGACGLATAALVATGGAFAPADAGGSHGAPKVKVLTNEVAVPFNLELTRRGILVADGAGFISRLGRSGSPSVVIPDVPGASGVAASKKTGKIAYTFTDGDENGINGSGLKIRSKDGSTVTADTLAYETANNPDGSQHYGLTNPTQCQTDALNALQFPVDYTGIVDSHAYSVASWGKKSWVVADAGGNDLLKVDHEGNISTLAVFPSQPLTLTQEMVDTFPPIEGVDYSCLVGAVYEFEPVPTDVEVGRKGYLYVTTLPGGPEDASFGARGSVWRVNPWTGAVKQVATGFLGATNLALTKNGNIYVTELFAGKVSKVWHGGPKTVVELPGAVSVEAHDNTLYAGTFDFSGAPGTVVKIKLGKHGNRGGSRS